MTSPNGVKKFEDKLSKVGVNYDVRASIVGQEKVDFIKSSRIAFNPSVVESYGMAFYEQHIQLPTLVLENQRWTNNFNEKFYYTCSRKDMAIKAKQLYESFSTSKFWYDVGSLRHAIGQEKQVFNKWYECFNEFKPKESNTNTAKICNETTVLHKDFIEELGRSIICIDDVRSVLTNKHKFRIIYTDSDTYLTKDPSFEPQEKEESLFSW